MALCESCGLLFDMKTKTLILAKYSYYLSASDLLIPNPTSDIILSHLTIIFPFLIVLSGPSINTLYTPLFFPIPYSRPANDSTQCFTCTS